MDEFSAGERDRSGWWEIRLDGHLDDRGSAWFDGLNLTNEADGTTVIRGPVPDQAALHGLLHKVRDVGLPLVSAKQMDRHDAPTTEPWGPATAPTT